MKLSKIVIRKKILYKLARHKFRGGKHTSVESVARGFPKEFIKDVKTEIKELIREGFIKVKSTHYGIHVSLSMDKKEEIEKIIFND